MKRIKMWLTAPRYRHFQDVFWFAVITLSIHYSYRFWANTLDFRPLAVWMGALHDVMTGWVFHQSVWINQHVLCIPMTLSDHKMTFANGSWIAINGSCAGDKQILQFMLLLLIYPGPWRHKLWFIPLGMVILHFTNILRIVLLSQVSLHVPEWWHLAHNTILRAMFYIVILALWIIWRERINKRPPAADISEKMF